MASHGQEEIPSSEESLALTINSLQHAEKNAGLEEAQAGIKIARRNINNFRYADGTTLMKSLLMKVKEESEKAGLKLNIQIMKIMESSPITSR